MYEHRTTVWADSLDKIGRGMEGIAGRLAAPHLPDSDRLALCARLMELRLTQMRVSEEVRRNNRGPSRRKAAPPDQEQGAAFQVAS